LNNIETITNPTKINFPKNFRQIKLKTLKCNKGLNNYFKILVKYIPKLFSYKDIYNLKNLTKKAKNIKKKIILFKKEQVSLENTFTSNSKCSKLKTTQNNILNSTAQKKAKTMIEGRNILVMKSEHEKFKNDLFNKGIMVKIKKKKQKRKSIIVKNYQKNKINSSTNSINIPIKTSLPKNKNSSQKIKNKKHLKEIKTIKTSNPYFHKFLSLFFLSLF
jgi:hypothetical protein